ncbi:MAG: FAD synthase [Thermodesulfovibrionales bacterium]|nr:FAD synthase [Thermodesulfovibrionales bacterium]
MKKRVVCAGTFDHLHPGHLDFLRQAKALGDELIVIVARDETVKRIKGFLPTDSEEVRKRNVEQTNIADKVVLGNYNADIFEILKALKPDIVALGYDQRVKETEILKRFTHLKVIRLSPYQADKYKSSFYRK